MILAIDPSESRTGWCKGLPGGPVLTGSLSLGANGRELGKTLAALDDWLDRVLDGVTLITYEQPIQFGFQSFASRRKLYSLGALIELRGLRAGINVREVNNQTCKKLCYGSARMKSAEVKERAIGLARLWGFEPGNHDEADACAVFLVAVQKWHPEAFEAWEARRRAAGAEAGEALL
jgi:Holliday junction resolvasome RuvABC endonuclease subunit